MLECPFSVNTKMQLHPEILKKHCMILFTNILMQKRFINYFYKIVIFSVHLIMSEV